MAQIYQPLLLFFLVEAPSGSQLVSCALLGVLAGTLQFEGSRLWKDDLMFSSLPNTYGVYSFLCNMPDRHKSPHKPVHPWFQHTRTCGCRFSLPSSAIQLYGSSSNAERLLLPAPHARLLVACKHSVVLMFSFFASGFCFF